MAPTTSPTPAAADRARWSLILAEVWRQFSDQARTVVRLERRGHDSTAARATLAHLYRRHTFIRDDVIARGVEPDNAEAFADDCVSGRGLT